ncbi:Uncharacterised protein [Klebsiella pneumoniae]|nr:Uncharacterised protein [Klebsiella pneumoniae]
MGVTELRRLRQLEEENHRLKRLVADLSLDKEMLQEVIKKSSEAGLRSVRRCIFCGRLTVSVSGGDADC